MGRNALVGALLVLLVAAVCALLVVAGAFVIALNGATGWLQSWWLTYQVLTYWVVGGTLSLVGFVLSGILAKSRIGEAVCVGLIAAGIVGPFLLYPRIDPNGVVGEAVGSLTIITLVVGLLGIAFRDGGFGLVIKALIYGFYGSLASVVSWVAFGVGSGDWLPSWLPSWLPNSVAVVLWIPAGLCFLAGVMTLHESRKGKAVCFGFIAVGVVGLFFLAIRDAVFFPNGVVDVLAAITCAVGLVGLLVGLLLLLDLNDGVTV